MNTTKYEIELPTLPDGFEIVGHISPIYGDMYLTDVKTQAWRLCDHGDFTGTYFITARPRETLAGWANKQRLFQALAEMPWSEKSPVFLDSGTSPKMGWWLYHGELNIGSAPLAYFGVPPNNLTGKLRLEDGKWVDAT